MWPDRDDNDSKWGSGWYYLAKWPILTARPTPLFYSGSFRQLLLTVHCYLPVCLSASEPGQHRLVWKKRKTWWLLAFLEVFSLCRHVQRDFVLRYENWTEHDPTCCTNNTPRHVSSVPGSHIKHKLQFGAQYNSHAPVWCPGHLSGRNLNVSILLLCFFLYSLLQTPFPFSCVVLLHPSSLRSRLSNYQRLACRLVTLDWVISTDCFPWDSVE